MNLNPKLFIGSASESLQFAHALEFELQNVARPEVWDRAFRPGHYTLEDLTRKATEVDFAAFILGQEDETDSRGEIALSPRDNVVYEAGLFAGHLGVSRVFLLVNALGTKIPTDWKGLGYVTYDPSLQTPRDAIQHAAIGLREQISEWGMSYAASLEQRISGPWWQSVLNTDEGAVVSLMKIIPPTGSSHWQVRGTAWTCEGKSIAEYQSRTATLDVSHRKLFYYWAGEHPLDAELPDFFGVGEIEFQDLSAGSVSRAKGRFSETQRMKPEATKLKATRYMRASETDVQVAEGNDAGARKRLINARLGELRQMQAGRLSID